MKYDTMYFLMKFDAIPENKWCTGLYNQGNKRCALGHCGFHSEITNFDPKEGNKLEKLLEPLFGEKKAPAINDNSNGEFTDLGETPKERIMNALILIKAGVTI